MSQAAFTSSTDQSLNSSPRGTKSLSHGSPRCPQSWSRQATKLNHCPLMQHGKCRCWQQPAGIQCLKRANKERKRWRIPLPVPRNLGNKKGEEIVSFLLSGKCNHSLGETLSVQAPLSPAESYFHYRHHWLSYKITAGKNLPILAYECSHIMSCSNNHAALPPVVASGKSKKM